MKPNLADKLEKKQSNLMGPYDNLISKFVVGENVWIQNNRGGIKNWIPATIVKCKGSKSYIVSSEGKNKLDHIDQIRKRVSNKVNVSAFESSSGENCKTFLSSSTGSDNLYRHVNTSGTAGLNTSSTTSLLISDSVAKGKIVSSNGLESENGNKVISSEVETSGENIIRKSGRSVVKPARLIEE